MRFEGLLTAGSLDDLQEIAEYIAMPDSPVHAGHVLDRLEEAVAELPSCQNAARIRRNCSSWAFANTGRGSSSPIG